MRFALNIRQLRKTPLLRVIAVLFLLHCAVDLFVPELCTEEPFSITSSSSVISATGRDNVATAVVAAGSSESQQEPGSDPQHRGEDCFCCCSHVMPSPVFATVDNVELAMANSSVQTLFIPSAPPDNPYHPPRLA